jgi:hypothetical protein
VYFRFTLVVSMQHRTRRQSRFGSPSQVTRGQQYWSRRRASLQSKRGVDSGGFEQHTFEDFHDAAKEGDAIRVAQYIVAKLELRSRTRRRQQLAGDPCRRFATATRYRHKYCSMLVLISMDGVRLRSRWNFTWDDHPVTRLSQKHSTLAIYPKAPISLLHCSQAK